MRAASPTTAIAGRLTSDTLRVCKEPLLVSVVALIVLLTFACHRTAQAPDIQLEYDVSPRPARVGTATIDLKLTQQNGQPMSGARVELEGNMSHPGMSPVSGETTEIEPGRHRGTLQLTMAGDWIIMVHITLADGQRLQRQIELNAVRSD